MLNQSFDNFEKMNLGLVIAPESLAYITFTSGTTGLPKGVPQNHRYLLRITQVFTNACHICPQDRIALTYSNAFGIAGLQIFPALLNGASLWPFVLSDGVEALATWLAVAQITY